MCSETALEGIITGLLPYLKNIYFRRAVRWAGTRSPFLPGCGGVSSVFWPGDTGSLRCLGHFNTQQPGCVKPLNLNNQELKPHTSSHSQADGPRDKWAQSFRPVQGVGWEPVFSYPDLRMSRQKYSFLLISPIRGKWEGKKMKIKVWHSRH